DIQAAIGCVQLDRLEDFADRRRANWNYLKNGLAEFSDIFILPEATPNTNPSWFGFLISLRSESGISRPELIHYLENKKIQTRMLFGGNLIRQPFFDAFREQPGSYRVVGDLTNTDLIMNNGFWLGVYPGLTTPMLDYMIDAIRSFLRRDTVS
ncbi:MAG TPA: DegT/DnrJ/EryC1/StrS family aminotransferase, partial [bacterium]|nr:DegT/DnrJ/EryC1/StrS family aminotransferase [bacterium]